MNQRLILSGSFDDLRPPDIRLLEDAATLGELTALVWTDEMCRRFNGQPPKFPLAERLYFLKAVRYICRVGEAGRFPVGPEDLPPPSPDAPASSRKKVVVTGSYDWLHSGHVRFFEEASAYGDLYVVVGHDANIRLLKGEGHPLLPQEQRRYMVQAIRVVKQALISTGEGWLDADPEIRRLKPDLYIVNQDGDKGGKREYCEKLGIQYVVLNRAPLPGLPPRSSTDLRGF
jgi:cytidyltransferase-like protein